MPRGFWNFYFFCFSIKPLGNENKRNQKKYDESLVAYKQALTLNPKHKGAHEYIGEAYIQMGQLDKAKEHLAILDKLCFFSCEEYRDLKKAITQAQ